MCVHYWLYLFVACSVSIIFSVSSLLNTETLSVTSLSVSNASDRSPLGGHSRVDRGQSGEFSVPDQRRDQLSSGDHYISFRYVFKCSCGSVV